MNKYQIQTRPNDSTSQSDWTTCGLGEPGANEFDSREDAEAAIDELRALGNGWENACYRVVALK